MKKKFKGKYDTNELIRALVSEEIVVLRRWRVEMNVWFYQRIDAYFF